MVLKPYIGKPNKTIEESAKKFHKKGLDLHSVEAWRKIQYSQLHGSKPPEIELTKNLKGKPPGRRLVTIDRGDKGFVGIWE